MKKNNLDKQVIKDYAIGTCKIVGPMILTVLSTISVKDVVKFIRYSGKVDYNDVANAIMSSSMYSNDKVMTISAIQRNKDSDFYKGIIEVVNSSMRPADKVKLIKDMCKDEP